MTIYDVGEPVLLQNRFYNQDVTGMTELEAAPFLANPTAVTLTIRDPDGALLTPPVAHPSLGTYTYVWTPLVRGMHEIHWVATGAVAAVDQYGINVRGGFPATTDLVDVQTVRAFMRMPKAEDDQDPILEQLISDVSAYICTTYQHEFAPATTVASPRTFAYRGGGILDLAPYNAQAGTITGITLDADSGTLETLVEFTDWFSAPAVNQWGVVNYLRMPTQFPYPTFTRSDIGHQQWRRVTVTAKWGYPTIPPMVAAAAKWTVMHWHRKYVGSRPSAFTDDAAEESESTYAMPTFARQLMRDFENRSIFA